MIEARVECRTLDLTTFVLRYPRYILPQVLTHRNASRNTSSSRAIPVTTIIRSIEDPINYWEPVWVANQKGMTPDREQAIEIGKAKHWWFKARETALLCAREMSALNVSKQVANRLLEPFMLVEQVFTLNDKWLEDFLAQRNHPDAQDEIILLARAMEDAVNRTPSQLGPYHLPFVTEDVAPPIAMALSAARCARVSYTKVQPKSVTAELAFAKKLWTAKHRSPFDHPAKLGFSPLYVSFTEYRQLLLRGDLCL